MTSLSSLASARAVPAACSSAPDAELESWPEAGVPPQIWQLIVEHANDPVIVTTTELSNPGPRIVYVNQAFSQLTGYAAAEVIGQTPRLLQGSLTSRAEMSRMRTELQAGRPFVGQTINYTKSGQEYWMEWSVYGLRDETGILTYYVAVQRDISARKRYESQIEEQARQLEEANAQLAQANARLNALSLTDSLTGIANHRALHARLDEEIARSTRYGTPLSLLLVDVDPFKAYNDDFGHPAGDVALQNIARLLQQHARQSDMVARHGGEEFAVLLPQTESAGALFWAEALRAAIESAEWPMRGVTVSIGAASFDAASFDAASFDAAPSTSSHADCPATKNANYLMDRADKALYCSKERGRNCVN